MVLVLSGETPVEHRRKTSPYLTPLNASPRKSPRGLHGLRVPHRKPSPNLSTNLHPPRTSNNLITMHRLNYGIDREL
jgi:hypothetical protein